MTYQQSQQKRGVVDLPVQLNERIETPNNGDVAGHIPGFVFRDIRTLWARWPAEPSNRVP